MWSMGNEEMAANTGLGVSILTAMKAVAAEYDGSRPVSLAPLFAVGAAGLAVGDVVGYNYMDPAAEAFHKAHPERPVMGTEQVSAVGTRGIYITDPKTGFVSSYAPYTTTGRASAEGWWRFCDERPWLAGGFVWTGFDYRGEPAPNGWPNISSQYGVIDTCGFPKDTFFYYQSWWQSRPVLHLFPHWNWPGMEGEEIAVWVHSNLEKVELLLNGRSLGTKETKKNSHLAWNVPYAPGHLEARGYRGGRQLLTTVRETTGPAAMLVATADRNGFAADGQDCTTIAIAVEDAQGRLVPVADDEVTFEVTGAGKLIGVGNGNPTSHEPDHGSARRAFCGLCAAIIQSTKTAGPFTIMASAPGLKPATLTLAAKPARERPEVAVWERDAPAGQGVTGLWRPAANAPAVPFGMNGSMLFTLRQDGNKLTGSVEGKTTRFEGVLDQPVAIDAGQVDAAQIIFKTVNASYTGVIDGDELRLQRTLELGGLRALAAQPSPGTGEKRPAIGPPPDGMDPSLASALAQFTAPQPVVLRRVKR
jgi:beta-galactosidase